MVVTLFGKRQTIEFTALARPRCSGATIPMRNESPIGADMFIKAARTMYRPAAATAFVTNARDRKSTRLNSSHVRISYAVFCLKKKKELNCGSGTAHMTRTASLYRSIQVVCRE